jgi:hypothetical protein
LAALCRTVSQVRVPIVRLKETHGSVTLALEALDDSRDQDGKLGVPNSAGRSTVLKIPDECRGMEIDERAVNTVGLDGLGEEGRDEPEEVK